MPRPKNTPERNANIIKEYFCSIMSDRQKNIVSMLIKKANLVYRINLFSDLSGSSIILMNSFNIFNSFFLFIIKTHVRNHGRRYCDVPCISLCMPDMGAVTNGVKVPCGLTRVWNNIYQPLAEGKGISARMCLKEAGAQNREPTNRPPKAEADQLDRQ